ncbi:MAG: class I SAM-dependent methyltransferase [Candidatus Thorarchaeota archaeon]
MLSKDGHDIDDTDNAVPFTSRLLAHYRAEETKRDARLISDPFAERLAGDLSPYFEKHKRTSGTGDYAIVRTFHIDDKILNPWCNTHKESQIVILGAGLDTRAYRIAPLQKNKHTVFEIDFEVVNNYKEQILQNETPFCKLVRISSDLTKPEWISDLLEGSFSKKIPTLWILEGLTYYLEQDAVISILQIASKKSAEGSQIFADLCVPGLTEARFGPFMMHFKWGLNEDEVPSFFEKSGWNVSSSFADEHDQGRDVGQRGLMFVEGTPDPTGIGVYLLIEEPSEEAVLKITDPELQRRALTFLRKIKPKIESIVYMYQKDRDNGLNHYYDFVIRVSPNVLEIIQGFSNIVSVGHISPRLLKDPLKAELNSPEEEEAHIVGYLKAILSLAYCGIKGLEGEQYSNTKVESESQKVRKLSEIPSLIELIHKEIR